MSGDAESAEALLHSGANVMATDPKGNTPLPLAVGYRGSEASAHRLLQLTGAHALRNWLAPLGSSDLYQALQVAEFFWTELLNLIMIS